MAGASARFTPTRRRLHFRQRQDFHPSGASRAGTAPCARVRTFAPREGCMRSTEHPQVIDGRGTAERRRVDVVDLEPPLAPAAAAVRADPRAPPLVALPDLSANLGRDRLADLGRLPDALARSAGDFLFRSWAGAMAPFRLPCLSMAQRTASRSTAARSPFGTLWERSSVSWSRSRLRAASIVTRSEYVSAATGRTVGGASARAGVGGTTTTTGASPVAVAPASSTSGGR